MEEIKNKKKVLIIDDNRDLNGLLVDKLNAAGLSASGALDGEDGLKKALEIHPDLILLDVLMPKKDGWQTIKELRNDQWGKDAKVIMLTVLDDDNYVAEAVDMKISGYLVKTDYKLDDLVKQVKSALDMK